MAISVWDYPTLEKPQKLIRTGKLLWTREINDKIAEDVNFSLFVLACMGRHCRADWGDCCEEDRKANDYALTHQLRLLSVYKTDKVPDGKIWIITEWDRSATTVLFPSEY